jgi:hypothetical protein
MTSNWKDNRGSNDTMRKYYAHSLPGKPPEEWQLLEDHLRNVAEKARGFADEFGAGEWAYLAGLWHDLWKGDKWIFTLTETRVRS